MCILRVADMWPIMSVADMVCGRCGLTAIGRLWFPGNKCCLKSQYTKYLSIITVPLYEAYITHGIAVDVCLSVRPSVCRLSLSNACIVTKRKHLTKKVQLWLIESCPRAFQWNLRWTSYVAPNPRKAASKATILSFPYKTRSCAMPQHSWQCCGIALEKNVRNRQRLFFGMYMREHSILLIFLSPRLLAVQMLCR